jgi:DNA-binding transcriptional ArsR family regulator
MNTHSAEKVRSTNTSSRGLADPRPPLPHEAVESIAAWLQVVGEPSRVRLIEILNRGGATVQLLAAQLRTTRQNATKHLTVLHRAGIVSRRKVGTRVEYQLCDWSCWWLIEQIASSLAAATAAE